MARDAAISWSRLSRFIADAMGLHFPRERWTDLHRAVAGAAEEFGFNDVAAFADWLLSAPLTQAQLQVLASHLTIGETYFFRDRKMFEVLATHVLPELIQARRGREQRLRVWSAACCTGEEAYSLAILLQQVLPDPADWQVTILATDINGRFLQKAVAGSFGAWSFRDAPPGIQERYFNRSGDGRYVVVPKIKDLVTFAHVNLAEDVYPSLATDTNAMDLILCRNVLMYFTPAQTVRVIEKLHHALVDGGWLAVSPSEASHTLFRQFATQNFPGVILYQKTDTPVRTGEHAAVTWCYEPERYAEAADTLLTSLPTPAPEQAPEQPPEPQTFASLARALANQGKLTEALRWCDRWIAADKLDSAGHYVRAIVLLEHGDADQARGSLQRAIYLHPDFVLAHFALGNLARRRGQPGEADRHFSNALHLLARQHPDAPLPEADGLTAGRLTETITALTGLVQVP